jgi:hypothetical protein
MKLDKMDLNMMLRRTPSVLLEAMKKDQWKGGIFIGGGFARAVVANETVNDIDVFVKSATEAELLAYQLCKEKKDVYRTDNAFTIKGKLPIQIIHRWVFEHPESVAQSFDFTICCAVIYYDAEEKQFDSYCDDRFYTDLANKRLVYRRPVRNEDAGGSMLRVLKYYQKGYRIPLDSLGAVIARLIKDFDTNIIPLKNEEKTGWVITGLLREVDPAIDPQHEAHLGSMETEPEL